MSYILNALRKSEQERQANQPGSITNRIMVHQPSVSRNSSRLIAALVISNLAILAYFLGFTEKTPPTAPQPAVPEVKTKEESLPKIIPQPPAVVRIPETKIPPAPEIVRAKPAPALTPPLAVKQAAVNIKKPVIENEKPSIAPPPPVTPIQQPVQQQIEPAKTEIVKPATPILKDDLPFIDELPADFRSSIPELPINVFSYTTAPAQRFVMIDMIKYVPGQRIKDMLELKEIREDSIVVNYDHHTFKIKRP
jgi:general secretion pathway protein B